MTSPSPAVVKDGVPPPVPPSNRPSASTFASPAASAAVIARNAIRYTVSEREYALLHRYVLARSRALRKRLPVPASTAAEAGVESKLAPSSTGSAEGPSIPGKKRPPIHTMKSPLDDGDYNARAVRHAVRVFLATAAAMKAWEMVRRRLPGGHLGGAYG